MRCSKCGNKIKSDTAFCTHCGQKIGCNDFAVKDTEKQTAPFPYKKILIVGIVIVFCLVYFFGFRCKVGICPLPSSIGNEYCIAHTCKRNDCKNKKAPDSSYCYTHTPSYSSSPSYTPESAEDVLEFSNVRITHNSLFTVCTATLTNNGRRTYTFVEVKGKFKDSSGKVLDTDWTYAVGSEGLAPGESTTFEVSVDKDWNIKECSMEILDYDKE